MKEVNNKTNHATTNTFIVNIIIYFKDNIIYSNSSHEDFLHFILFVFCRMPENIILKVSYKYTPYSNYLTILESTVLKSE